MIYGFIKTIFVSVHLLLEHVPSIIRYKLENDYIRLIKLNKSTREHIEHTKLQVGKLINLCRRVEIGTQPECVITTKALPTAARYSNS